MLCPSCNKFAAFDTSGDPEVDFEIDRVEDEGAGDGEDAETGLDKAIEVRCYITGTVRIVLTSECCSEDMKEANFDIETEIELSRADGCTCDFANCSLTTSEELTDRQEAFSERIAKRGPNKGQTVKTPIPARYQKRFYGTEVAIEVSCECGKTTADQKWSDEVPASGMDELT